MRSVTLIAAFLFCFLTSSEAATAKLDYAALAVVWKQGKKFHGLGYGATASEAKKAALTKCANPRCQIATVYRPGQCIHLVIGAYQIFWNDDRFGPKEDKAVMNFCRSQDPSCRKLKSECLPK